DDALGHAGADAGGRQGPDGPDLAEPPAESRRLARPNPRGPVAPGARPEITAGSTSGWRSRAPRRDDSTAAEPAERGRRLEPGHGPPKRRLRDRAIALRPGARGRPCACGGGRAGPGVPAPDASG